MIKKQKVEPAFGIEFTLIPEQRKQPPPDPLVPADFTGYYQGTVQIVSAPLCPELVGFQVLLICNKRLPFCAPYFIYHCPGGITMDTKEVLSGQNKCMRLLVDGPPCRAVRYKSQWLRSDFQYVLDECAPRFSAPIIMKPLAQRRLDAQLFPKTTAVEVAPWISQHSLVGKGFLWSSVFVAFRRWSQKQRRRMASLSFQQLQELSTLYREEPWELVWETVLDTRFAKLKPMDFDTYLSILRGRKEPDHVRYALTILWKMRHLSKFSGDTLFGFEKMGGPIFPCLPRDERIALERSVYAYCQTRDIVCFEGPRFTFQADYNYAKAIVNGLKDIKQNNALAFLGPLSLRGLTGGVPTKPPRLTNDQFRIAEHITQHWITIVLGSPGTGKTAIITWLLSHYQRALAVGFVGMLVKMLQRRNGRRRELAYTIDHLLFNAEIQPAPVRRWLSHFEVLVIDECSNVSMARLARLLPLFQRLRKIVFVGDTHQLKSLKPGDALGDLAASFPQHCFCLTENLRVAPELKALQDVPTHILANNWRSIQWGARAWDTPVSHVDPEAGGTGPAAMIKALYAKLLLVDRETANQLLDTQILALTHDGPYGRMRLNEAAQQAYEELGILRKSDVYQLHKDCSVYVGCKITFKKNYNHPIEQTFGKVIVRSDPIANGELVIICKITPVRKPGMGILLEVTDSSDSTAASKKTVWIDAALGVDPFHVQCGNVTTVYSSQGREFPNVIFCVPPNIATHWTRANAYVAASRAQRRLVIMGPLADFGAICGRVNVERRTVLAHLLAQEEQLTTHAGQTTTTTETIIRDPDLLQILPSNVLAVPMFQVVNKDSSSD